MTTTKNIPLKYIKSVFAEYSINKQDLETEFDIDNILSKFAEYNLPNDNQQLKSFLAQVRIIYLSDNSSKNLVAQYVLKTLSKTKTREQVIRLSDFSKQIRNRDKVCRLTGMGGLYNKRCEAAHILDFALCDTDVEKYDLNNGILLFDGIHKSWDAGYLIAIPNLEKKSIQFCIRDSQDLSLDDINANLPEFSKIRVLENINDEMMRYFNIRYEIDIKRFAKI